MPTSKNSPVVQRANVGDLPRFNDSAVVKVADDRLVHTEGSPVAWDAGEVATHCPRDDDPCHFQVPLGYDLLHLVVKVGQGCYLLLRFEVLSGESSRCLDYDITM
jgi:hypothetical protein